MCTDHRTRAAVEVKPHRYFLTCRLSVQVDDNRPAIPKLRQSPVRAAEGAIKVRSHERAPHEVHHRHSILLVDAPAGSAFRVVQRPHDGRIAVKDWINLAVFPYVVA